MIESKPQAPLHLHDMIQEALRTVPGGSFHTAGGVRMFREHVGATYRARMTEAEIDKSAIAQQHGWHMRVTLVTGERIWAATLLEDPEHDWVQIISFDRSNGGPYFIGVNRKHIVSVEEIAEESLMYLASGDRPAALKTVGDYMRGLIENDTHGNADKRMESNS